MIVPRTRREFLAEVGRGMLIVSVGHSIASELGFSRAFGADAPDLLDFGPLEPLVRFMQETPVNKLLPGLAAKLRSGTELRQRVAGRDARAIAWQTVRQRLQRDVGRAVLIGQREVADVGRAWLEDDPVARLGVHERAVKITARRHSDRRGARRAGPRGERDRARRRACDRSKAVHI